MHVHEWWLYMPFHILYSMYIPGDTEISYWYLMRYFPQLTEAMCFIIVAITFKLIIQLTVMNWNIHCYYYNYHVAIISLMGWNMLWPWMEFAISNPKPRNQFQKHSLSIDLWNEWNFFHNSLEFDIISKYLFDINTNQTDQNCGNCVNVSNCNVILQNSEESCAMECAQFHFN